MQINDIYEFSLFNKKDNRGYWIAENGAENGISVSHFNIDAMRITVTLNGRTEQLTLMTATDRPLPVASSTPAEPTKRPQPNIPGLNTNNTKQQINDKNSSKRRRESAGGSKPRARESGGEDQPQPQAGVIYIYILRYTSRAYIHTYIYIHIHTYIQTYILFYIHI